VSWWFSKTSSTTCAVFTCSWSARLKGAIFMKDANPLWTLFLQECGLSTPPPNTNISWQWISRVEIFCLYKLSHHSFLHDSVFTIITSTHKLIPQIAWLTDFCTVCGMLPLLLSVPPTTK
jgi:hypothetical protein